MTIPSELLEKYNMTSMEQYKEMFGDSVDTEIMVYKTFLIQTDHIPNKIIEQLIEDLASATLLNFVEVFLKIIVSIRTEYKELFQYRKLAREEINRLTEVTV